jgi:hypothetical protein
MTGAPPTPDGFPTALTGRIQAIVDATLSLVPRIARLPDMLDTQLLHGEASALLRALQDMHHAVDGAEPETPSSLWRRTWPFRSKQSATLLRDRLDEALRTAAPLTSHVQALRASHAAQQQAARHSLARLERTRAGIDPRVRQAQDLLAELWDTLRPQRPDPEDQESLHLLRMLLADVDRQRVALQRLEGLCAAAADAGRFGQLVLAGREAVLELLGDAFDAAWRDWRGKVEPLARADRGAQDVLEGSGQAIVARAALLRDIDKVRIACTRLQIDEQAFGQALVHLREQLAPFAQ